MSSYLQKTDHDDDDELVEPLELQIQKGSSEQVQSRLCWEISDLKRRITTHNKENNKKMDGIKKELEEQKEEREEIQKDLAKIIKELSDRVLTLEIEKKMIIRVVAFICGLSTVASAVCSIIAILRH